MDDDDDDNDNKYSLIVYQKKALNIVYQDHMWLIFFFPPHFNHMPSE